MAEPHKKVGEPGAASPPRGTPALPGTAHSRSDASVVSSISPTAKHANYRPLHTRRSSKLGRDLARCYPTDSSRSVRRPGGTFTLAADAKRSASRVRDQHAIRAVSHPA